MWAVHVHENDAFTPLSSAWDTGIAHACTFCVTLYPLGRYLTVTSLVLSSSPLAYRTQVDLEVNVPIAYRCRERFYLPVTTTVHTKQKEGQRGFTHEGQRHVG